MFALEKENECFRNENKNQQAIIEILIENSNKNTCTWKTAEKKIATTLNSKLDSTNQLSIVLNAFATSNNVFNEITEDEEVNDNVKIDNNPQKSQPEVKSRPNVAITENYIDITITLKINDAADLVTFTEEILNRKLHFLCSTSKELENYIPIGIEGIFIELNLRKTKSSTIPV